MTAIDSLDWDGILEYIESEQAVLFIGPELAQIGEDPLSKNLSKKILDKFKNKIAYYHAQENLFLFSNRIVKNDAARFVRNYLTENQPNEYIYKMIAQIKFHLIVSLNPDSFLSDICYKYGVRHRFSYFKSKYKGTDDIEEPTIEKPLIYNLCGNKKDDESLILDYEDLFRFVASSLSAASLPVKLTAALEKARIFFFIGFSFERWHTQLLLRLLCGEEESQKYASTQQQVDDNTQEFLYHQFQIDFLEKNTSFLEALHQKCAEKGLLRDIYEASDQETTAILKRVQNDKDLYGALDLLKKKHQNTNYLHEVTLLMSQYNHLLDLKTKGTIDSRDYFVQYNKIIDNILDIANKHD